MEFYINPGDTIECAVKELFIFADRNRTNSAWIRFNDIIIKRSAHDTTEEAVSYFWIESNTRSRNKRNAEKDKLTAALTRAAKKIHDFEGGKRAVESIIDELMGGGEDED